VVRIIVVSLSVLLAFGDISTRRRSRSILSSMFFGGALR
jgi:hypothetical protein